MKLTYYYRALAADRLEEWKACGWVVCSEDETKAQWSQWREFDRAGMVGMKKAKQNRIIDEQA